MSYARELYEEMMIDEMTEQLSLENKLKELASKGLWITKDKKVLKMSEMTTNHINNCIRRFEDSDSAFAVFVPALKEELRIRERLNEFEQYLCEKYGLDRQ